MDPSPKNSSRTKNWLVPAVVALGLAVLFIASAFRNRPVETDPRLEWERDLSIALQLAKEQDKLILMDIYADWCGPCIQMDRETYTNEALLNRLDRYIPLKIDADRDTETALEYGTGSLPTTVVVNAKGALLTMEMGYLSVDQMIRVLDRVEEPFNRIEELEAQRLTSPNDPVLTLEIAKQYAVVLDAERAHAELDAIEDLVTSGAHAEHRPRWLYQKGVAFLLEEQYDAGLALFKDFKAAYADHTLWEKVDELETTGMFFHGMNKLDSGDVEGARPLLERVAQNKHNREMAGYAAERLAELE